MCPVPLLYLHNPVMTDVFQQSFAAAHVLAWSVTFGLQHHTAMQAL